MIIATAGHVDHGKTSLIKALTGTDTDRLPEEKRRGLTIELGFAYDHLEGGEVLGFIDVPGHERFISNMLAGIASLDFALLIVAADDGPMPQTLEHLAALDLMGVTRGAVALTKCDQVSAERAAEVEAEIGEILRETGLASMPVFSVSSISGEGIAALRVHLEQAARETKTRSGAGNFRFAVDRRFLVEGAGLVVTGTVHAGKISVGDTVVVSPGGLEARVRSLHEETRAAESSRAGHRCALNLAGPGIELERVARGDWIVAPPAHAPTRRFDARLKVLASEEGPLRHWTPVHVHMGAAHLTGRVAVLEVEKIINPGTEGDVQIILDAPTSVLWGDRFVVRDQSASRALGGGLVLDAFAPGRERTRGWRARDRLAHGLSDLKSALLALAEVHPEGYSASGFLTGRNLTGVERGALLAQIADDLEICQIGGETFVVTRARWDHLGTEVVACLERFHEDYPGLQGQAIGALRSSLPTRVPGLVLDERLGALRKEGRIGFTGQVLHLPGHEARLSEDDEAFARSLLALLSADPLCPPVVHDLAKTLALDPANLVRKLDHLTAMGRLVAMDRQRYFLSGQIVALAGHAEALSEPEGFTAAQFKDRAGIGRRPAVQILEYFDRVGLTRRGGNRRHVIRSASDVFGTAPKD
jgi:selenocysteine-specific elongation factor